MEVYRVAHIVVKTGMQSSQMGGMAQNVFLLYPVWDATIHLVILLHVCVNRQELDGILAIIVQLTPTAKVVHAHLLRVIPRNSVVNFTNIKTQIQAT